MERNLEAYIKVYDNWIDLDLCDKVVAELPTANWQQHQFYNSQTGEYAPRSGSNEFDFTYDTSYMTLIHDHIWRAYKKYLDDLNFFWFDGWSGSTQVKFNRYKVSQVMAKHCDHIHSAFDGNRKGIPMLTCLSLLNDDYKGGEFIMFDDTEIKLAKGSTVVFPSVFLYPHLVKPVTEGIRYSCVSWAW